MTLSLVAVAGCRPVLLNPEVDVDDGTTGGVHGGAAGDGTTDAPASTGPARTELSGSGSGGSGSGSPGVAPPPAGGLESSGTGTTETSETTESTESTGSTTGTTECGDGVVDHLEACDRTDLGGVACTDLGFLGGDLACAADCTHDPTPCIHLPEVGSLFFSEYVEGTSNNKALEIYNPTSSVVDLGSCQIQIYFNAIPGAGTTIQLAGIVGSNEVLVVCDSRIIDPTVCDILVESQNWFNGNDAVALVCSESFLDVFGQIGFDPGVSDPAEPEFPQWFAAPVGTANETLRRKCTVAAGDTNGFNPFDPALEWNTFPVDTFADLGQYVCP